MPIRHGNRSRIGVLVAAVVLAGSAGITGAVLGGGFTSPDTTPPQGRITAPTHDAVVGGASVTVTAEAEDDNGVASVQFRVGDPDCSNMTSLSVDTSFPYQISWDTTTVTNGIHALQIVVTDTAGLATTPPVCTKVSVSNGSGGDVTSPTVSITAPLNNATVSGSISLTAGATDNVGVAGVQFKVDGGNFGSEDTTAPYSVNLNTASLTNAVHTIDARARDSAGNTTDATQVSVTVQNGSTAGFVAYMSPTGSDTDASTCKTHSPPLTTLPSGGGCGTLAGALGKATCGQTIEVLPGTYTATQTINSVSAISGCAANPVKVKGDFGIAEFQRTIIFQNGACCVNLIGQSQVHGYMVSGPLPAATSGITMRPSGNPNTLTAGSNEIDLFTCAHDLSFTALDIGLMRSRAVHDITYIGGSIGGHVNAIEQDSVMGAATPSTMGACTDPNTVNVLIQDVLFHDVHRSAAPPHPDCLQTGGAHDFTLDRDGFVRCATSDVLAKTQTNIHPNAVVANWTVTNNFFGPLTEANGNVFLWCDVGTTCGTLDFHYNTVLTANTNFPGSPTLSGPFRVTNNYFVNGLASNTCSAATSKASASGGVWANNWVGSGPTCGTGSQLAAASSNVTSTGSGWGTGECPPTALNGCLGGSQYYNYLLKTGAALVNQGSDASVPAVLTAAGGLLRQDIQGGTRPNGSARDVAADEFGAP